MREAWETAFTLMADHGQGGACEVVAAGMRKVPPGARDQFRHWEAIADCLNAVAASHGTAH